MKKVSYIVIILVLSLLIGNIRCEENKTLPEDWNYCFEFTWIGPKYNNITVYNNNTCTDLMDSTRAKNIPCRDPIVITYDGSYPDIDYLWQHHKNSVLCAKTPGKVCVRYTYYFNNEPENATYMCSRVHTLGSENAITNGCYKEEKEGYVTELCICDKNTGPRYKPCNGSAVKVYTSAVLVLISFFMCKIIYM